MIITGLAALADEVEMFFSEQAGVPMQLGCVPLHVPSAWQVRVEEPTST